MMSAADRMPPSEGGDPPCWSHLLEDTRADIVDRHDIEVLVGSPTGLGPSRSVVDEAGGEAVEAVRDLLWERGRTAACKPVTQ